MTAAAAPGLQFPGHSLSIDLGGAVRTEGRGTISPFSSGEEGTHISKDSADKGQSVPESGEPLC